MYSSLSRSSPESSGDKRDVMLAADFEMNRVKRETFFRNAFLRNPPG